MIFLYWIKRGELGFRNSITHVENQTILCCKDISVLQLAMLMYTLIVDYRHKCFSSNDKFFSYGMDHILQACIYFYWSLFSRKAVLFTLSLVRVSVIRTSNYSPFLVQIIFLLLCPKHDPVFPVWFCLIHTIWDSVYFLSSTQFYFAFIYFHLFIDWLLF